MPAQTANELREFHRFLSVKVADAGSGLSPEEVLDEWRELHPAAEDVDAIQESLDAMAKGDQGMLFAEFDREFQKRHGFSA